MIIALPISSSSVHQRDPSGLQNWHLCGFIVDHFVDNVSRLNGSWMLTSRRLVLDELTGMSKTCYKYSTPQRRNSDLFHRSKHYDQLLSLSILLEPHNMTLNRDLCTSTTCSVEEYGWYSYIPNMGANIAVLAILAIFAIVQLYLAIKYRVWGTFAGGLVAGCVAETIGHVGRVLQSHGDGIFKKK